MAYFMCATSMTPPLGPIISGYASEVSWRLSFWIGFGIAVVGLPVMLLLPETYVPVIKRHLAGSEDSTTHHVTSKSELLAELKVIFSRPFVMMYQEPVVLFTSLYLAMIYSTLYLFFQAYPIIFQGMPALTLQCHASGVLHI